MRDGFSRRLRRVRRLLARGMEPHEAASQLAELAGAITETLKSSERRSAELASLLDDVVALRNTLLAEGLADVTRHHLERARAVVSVSTPRWSGYAAMDRSGGRDPDGALRSTAAHLAQLRAQLRDVMRAKGDEVSPELQDLAVTLESSSEAVRSAQVEAQWSRMASRRSDVGYALARTGRCAAEALRADAVLPAPPVGVPVGDVPAALLWLIADLSVALRRAGRIGPHARRHDAGVAARDCADLVVTTYRRWRPRLRGADAEAVASAALTAAYAAAWAGLATVVPDDDDAAGVRARLSPRPPGREGAAMAQPLATESVEQLSANGVSPGTFG